MLKNYLKIALRNILRQKGYSFINIIGLALGMACCIFLLLWIQHQISFDKFHKNADNLYRVEVEIPQPQGKIRGPNTPYPLGPAIQENIPEIKKLARWQSPPRLLIRYRENQFYEPLARAVDPALLQMFSFPLIKGNRETALKDPHSIVLSEAIAHKYFGNDDPMGKILSITNQYSFMVTGVMKDFPDNSTLRAEILIPFDFLKEIGYYGENWLSCNCMTWVELNDNSQQAAVGRKITDLYLNQILNQQSNFTAEEMKSATGTNAWNFVLMPLTNINLYGFNVFETGSIQTVRIFVMLAVMVLFIACINYMNLATAKSASRAKEIGLRKVVGANKKHIIAQVFGESILLAFIAIIIALILVILLLPAFNDLTGRQFSEISLLKSNFIFIILCITLLTGIMSGSYPALFLSTFPPTKTLKGNLNSGTKRASFRKSFVVVQFSLSVILIIVTLVAYHQLQFMLHKNLGYNKEHLVYIPLRSGTQDTYALLKEELLKNPAVVNVSGINNRPTNIVTNWNDASWEGKDPEFAPEIVYNFIDLDFIETMGIEIVDGRAFSKSFPGDVSHAFLVNEEMVKLMGTTSVVGKNFSFLRRTGTIVGVMKNFHHCSLASKIEPLVFLLAPNPYHLVVRLEAGNIPAAIENIKSVWQKINQQYPFVYSFLDEDFAEMYQADRQMSTIFRYAATLAIVIACIGLFALASFTSERRTKEIGIRKVLGASVPSIINLLSREFIILIAISNLIAWPLAYYGAKKWLQNFAYHIELSLLFFVIAGLLVLFITIMVVSFQSLKVAVTNPVESLRYE
ncbi:MAG: ABC transporter permease [bacterium]|nr:ABC transporter permease [bacterium]